MNNKGREKMETITLELIKEKMDACSEVSGIYRSAWGDEPVAIRQFIISLENSKHPAADSWIENFARTFFNYGGRERDLPDMCKWMLDNIDNFEGAPTSEFISAHGICTGLHVMPGYGNVKIFWSLHEHDMSGDYVREGSGNPDFTISKYRIPELIKILEKHLKVE